MKTLFWVSAMIMVIAEFLLLVGFVNVYFRNYNGGPQSSSGGIVYQVLLVLGILIAGFYCYFKGKTGWATAIMGLPIALLFLYLVIMIILPYFMGERMN